MTNFNMCEFAKDFSSFKINELLKVLGNLARYGSVIARKSSGQRYDMAMRNLMQPVAPKVFEVSKWPGTELLGDTAHLFVFELSENNVRYMSGLNEKIPRWLEPSLTEDLTEIFVSITHEQDGYFILTDDEISLYGEELQLNNIRQVGVHNIGSLRVLGSHPG